jgi:hypothetical protein
MEDDKLQRLHDTLAMLRPKGKTGGLGRGSLGIMKKDDDGLPKNALYSRFVRAGAGDNHHIKFNEAETDEKSEKKSKKNKKNKKKDDIEVEKEEDGVVNKKNKKRKADSEEVNSSSSSVPNVDWSEAIKSALKGEDDNAMDIKSLRKLVLKKFKVELGDQMTKEAKKSLFDAELVKIKKVSVEGSTVTYGKKQKSKKN